MDGRSSAWTLKSTELSTSILLTRATPVTALGCHHGDDWALSANNFAAGAP